jgi:hypothetical protein
MRQIVCFPRGFVENQIEKLADVGHKPYLCESKQMMTA